MNVIKTELRSKTNHCSVTSDGVLEDVLGLKEYLKKFHTPCPWVTSPWPWPYSHRSSKHIRTLQPEAGSQYNLLSYLQHRFYVELL